MPICLGEDCIARASEKDDPSASIELCDDCTAVLHRPRRRQPEAPNIRRVRRQDNAIIDTVLGARTDPVALPWSDDRQEQHALQFFVRNSAPQLAGYFDSPFWQRMILQAGRHEPAVKHAIAAIGALHEKLLIGAVSPDSSQSKRTRFALEQCNKSIRHLVKPAVEGKPPDLRLMLTTCVLFTCFEALQGHCEQAIIHATQGYSLLQQYASDPENKRWDVGAFAVELDQLCMLMRRLQTQSKGLMGKDMNLVPDMLAINAERPTFFRDLHEARSGLEVVLNQLTVYFMDLELDDHFYDMAVSNAEKHLLFAPWLESWEKAFSAFLTQHQAALSLQDRKAAMILKAHHLSAEIFAQVDLSLGEMGWDAFQDKFTAIVDLATAILEETTQADTSVIEARWKTGGGFISAPSATLSFSLGIVDPLYEVCVRCRDPVLRRKALNLLARHPRQECMWSSWSAWKVGKFVLHLEETGAEATPRSSSDIPAERRISEAWFDFSDKSTEESSKGRVGYRAAVPRATPRYALNPGLFEDRGTSEPVFTGVVEAGTVPTTSRPWTLDRSQPDKNVFIPSTGFDDSATSDWTAYDIAGNATFVPSITEPDQLQWQEELYGSQCS
ncbi:hypothetical protein LTR85_000715 [Meristemomyces frigidus]|nr:hypothetical protein LTR85_000715 [Meristemomyces frigidus]